MSERKMIEAVGYNKGPFHVRFSSRTDEKIEVRLQDILDELYKFGIIKTKGTVKSAKVEIKPYCRNTFETYVVFDE